MNYFAVIALCVATLSAHAQSPKKIKLDFNDNAVPAGWTLTREQGTNSGVAGGKFYAGEVDSRAILSTPYTVRPDTKNVTFEWFGSVFTTWSGTQFASQLVGPDNRVFMARIRTSEYLYGSVIQVELAGGDDYHAFDLHIPHGNYRLKAEFTDTAISLTGRLNGGLVFEQSLPLTGTFHLSEVSEAQLFVYETVGPDVWMDNVKIVQYRCEHPVSGSCP